MDSYVAIDLETTGLSPQKDEIIEVAGYKVEYGRVTDKFQSLVRPVAYIPRNIQALTGITYDMVKSCDPVEYVLLDFDKFCGELPLLGHNIKFDYEFLVRCGKPWGIDFSLKGTRTGIDTLELCRRYVNIGSNKLDSAIETLNLEYALEIPKDCHRAAYDAWCTKILYDYFLGKYPNLLDVKIPKILSADDNKYGKVINDEALPLD